MLSKADRSGRVVSCRFYVSALSTLEAYHFSKIHSPKEQAPGFQISAAPVGRADRLLPACSALKGERLSEDGSPPGKAPHLWWKKMKLSIAVCCNFVKQSQQGSSGGWPRQPEGLSSEGQLSNSENRPTICGRHSFNPLAPSRLPRTLLSHQTSHPITTALTRLDFRGP